MSPFIMVPVLLVALVLLLVLLLIRRCSEGFASLNQEQSIYVNIGSYRDAECAGTVKDAFLKADLPGRVWVGICQQNKNEDEDCLQLPGVDMSHVKSMTLDYSEAKGPTYARYLADSMYNGQDFVLQIDSHTRFVEGWDTKLIRMLKSCPASKPVITHYPPAYDGNAPSDALPGDMKTHVSVMCRSKWNGDGLPTFEAVMKPIETAGLRRVPFAAGGMIFSSGDLFQEVQLDPGLDYVFQGEEVLLSARMVYTRLGPVHALRKRRAASLRS